MNAEQPLRNRDVRGFENRSDRDGELLAARAALVETLATGGLARRLRRQLVGAVSAAVGAHRAIGPAQRFQQFAGGIVVGEVLAERREVLGRSRHEHSLRVHLDRVGHSRKPRRTNNLRRKNLGLRFAENGRLAAAAAA